MIREFRDFLAKGNVMDMAVGIIIGAAFTAIVAPTAGDLLQPVLGLLTAGTDFSNCFLAMDGGGYPTLRAAGAPVFAYSSFVTAVINVLIIVFVVFLLVKGVKRIKDAAIRKQVAETSAAGPSTEALLAEIRDLLAARPER